MKEKEKALASNTLTQSDTERTKLLASIHVGPQRVAERDGETVSAEQSGRVKGREPFSNLEIVTRIGTWGAG